MRREYLDNTKGVSETIGFIIILGIVMTGIALVTLYGYPALLNAQADANVKNMQKNMIVLQSDLKSLTFKNVPYQETAIQVSGGTLLIRKNQPDLPSFIITIDGSEIATIKTGELTFISADQNVYVALENGAVHTRYWSSPGGSVMIAKPSWFYDSVSRTYVLQFISLNASENFAQTGIGVVKMHISQEPSPNPPYPITGKTVKVTYKPNISEDYRVAWRNYFQSPDLQMTEVNDPGNITFQLNESDSLVIKRYNVTVISL